MNSERGIKINGKKDLSIGCITDIRKKFHSGLDVTVPIPIKAPVNSPCIDMNVRTIVKVKKKRNL